MRVGVLGGGQLGKMAGLAGNALGLKMRFWDPSPEAPAASTGEHIPAAYDDESALAAFADELDVITFEFENVPATVLDWLSQMAPIRPGCDALQVSQDRVLEKTFFGKNGIPAGEWLAVDSLEELRTAFDKLGSCIIKTTRFGYDGKGQYPIKSADDINAAWEAVGTQPLIAEKFVPFDRELSIIGVRGLSDEIRTWPLVENTHVNGILHKTVAPAVGVSAELQAEADSILRTIMEALDYVGVLTVELFDVAGKLLVNEMAPRVHNSGHWTIEGSVTSQFENHLRAITGMPLGSTETRFPSVMLNCIGSMPDSDATLQIKGVHMHDYGKSARKGRKVGHITLCDEFKGGDRLADRVAAMESLIKSDLDAGTK